jgi:sodium/proline symporter
MSGTTAILITLVVYKVVLLALGFVAQRRTHDAADFFLGGRKLGPWVTAISASASSSSAWSLLGVSGAAYAWGLASLWLLPACVGGFALNWYVLAPRLRRYSAERGALTVTDVLAGPPGAPGSSAIRWLCSAIVVLSLLVYVASQFQGAGKTFHETFELSMTTSILLGGGIVVVYTLMGGFWAVSLTDTLQGMMMVVAAVILPGAALVRVGGPAELVAQLSAVDVAGYGSLVRDLPGQAAIGFVLGLLGIGLGYPGQPHVVNRFMAARDEATLGQARRISMAWAGVLYTGMIVLGLCARVLLPDLADHEAAFIACTQAVLPPVLSGVMIAAVLSAVMSTADSQLLVAASSVAYDLPGAQSRVDALVGRSRIVVLALSILAMGAALVGEADIFSKVLFAWSAMGAAFGPLLLVEVIAGPVRPGHRFAAIACGFVLSVAAHLFVAGQSRGVAEGVAPFLVALAISLLGRRRAA